MGFIIDDLSQMSIDRDVSADPSDPLSVRKAAQEIMSGNAVRSHIIVDSWLVAPRRGDQRTNCSARNEQFRFKMRSRRALDGRNKRRIYSIIYFIRQFVLAISLNYIHCIYTKCTRTKNSNFNSLRLIFLNYCLLLFNILIILRYIKIT